MNRKAFLLYLKNIRDLELAKRTLLSLEASANSKYMNKKRKLDRVDIQNDYSIYKKEEAVGKLIASILLIIVGGLITI